MKEVEETLEKFLGRMMLDCKLRNPGILSGLLVHDFFFPCQNKYDIYRVSVN